MSHPRITVLMTVFNGGDYLRLSVESVLKQSYKDFEFLIIEDKGNDGSLSYLKSLTDPRVRIHENSENLGQTKSLNIGLKLAQGYYVARMDADDIASSRWLEYLFNFIQKNATCAIVSPKAAAINSNGKFSRILNSPETKEDITLKSFFASPINHVGCLMRRDIVYKDMGGYDERFKVVADYDLWSRLLRNGYELKHFPKQLVSVRFHKFSSTALEMGKKVIPETTQVMKENIYFWRNLKLDEESIVLLWHLVCIPETLTKDNYKKGLKLLNQIYDPSHFLIKQKRIVFAKRILGSLRNIKRHLTK